MQGWNDGHYTLANWLAATADVFLTPGTFYRRVPLRGDSTPARLFSLLHYLAMGVVSGIGGLLYVALESSFGRGFNPYGSPTSGVMMMCACMVPVLAWLMHRLIGILVLGYWSLNKTIPDLGWGRHVLAWETVYMWIAAGWNFFFFASTTLFGAWMSGIFGLGLIPRGPLPGYIEFDVFFFSNGILIVLWFYRYRLIARKVRWSNF